MFLKGGYGTSNPWNMKDIEALVKKHQANSNSCLKVLHTHRKKLKMCFKIFKFKVHFEKNRFIWGIMVVVECLNNVSDATQMFKVT